MIVLAAICLASCSVDRTTDDDFYFDDNSSDCLRVVAEVKGGIMSRASQFNQIEEGAYILTYPYSPKVINGDTTYTYSQANVNFKDYMGTTTYKKDPDGDDDDESNIAALKWSDIALRKAETGKSQSAVFYLDNVSPEWDDVERKAAALESKDLSSEQASREVWFRKGPDGKYDSPYNADIYDEAKNDLRWGWSWAYKNDTRVKFIRPDYPLHHNMSQVKVVLTVDRRQDNGAIVDLTHEAKLEITNVHLRPETFDRVTGNLGLPVDDPTESLVLIDFQTDDAVEPNSEGRVWAEYVDNNDLSEWPEGKDKPVESGFQSRIYTTKSFVLPPQALNNDDSEKRPHLKLTIPAKWAGEGNNEGEVVFEAALPQYMHIMETDDNGNEVTGAPMALSFAKEYRMTINAKIGPPDMELDFMPVYIEDWVDMGEQTISGNQAGIYTEKDFYDFMDAYNAGNTGRMEKFGYIDGKQTVEGVEYDHWRIQFWSGAIKLVSKDVKDEESGAVIKKGVEDYITYNEAIPFSFYFNNYVIQVTDLGDYSDFSGAAGQIKLYNLVVNGAALPEPGIHNKQGFLDMIAAYNGTRGSKADFGAYDNTGDRWVFEMGTNAPDVLEFTYEELHQMMEDVTINEKSGGNFAINLRDKKVKITGLPFADGTAGADNFIVLEGADGEALLHAILCKPAGIYSPEDVQWLSTAYNSLNDTEESDDPQDGDDTGTEDEPEVNTCEDLSWIF